MGSSRRSPAVPLAAVTLLVAGLAMALACGARIERPPLEVLQRESVLGAGKIVRIRSTTSDELTGVEVLITADGRQMRHTETRLGGHQTVEIGWKKLGGWQIPDDAEVEVRADGYLLPVRERLALDSNAEGE